MSDIAIQVENLSKRYRIGLKEEMHDTFTGAITSWLKYPFTNFKKLQKLSKFNNNDSSDDIIWALKDVSFEVKHGEVLGIIGRNGAGKSTLLKVLCRITEPTTGHVKINGRVASLLEVGTGFHPELTGRENIYLNGTVLGMKKKEIDKKFDEIVDFSGVEKFIDTPVKRYSSGMTVRLAFSVAAHLEPEVLLIDEVLAVGDAEFQRKCFNKMDTITTKGRTIILVSHNMTAINSLCPRALYLKDGSIVSIDESDKIINMYLTSENLCHNQRVWSASKQPGDEVARLISARIIDNEYKNLTYVDIGKSIGIEFIYEILKEGYLPIPNVHLFTSKGEEAFTSIPKSKKEFGNIGHHKSIMWIPPYLLNEGTYIAGLALATSEPYKLHFYEKEGLIFDTIEDINLRMVDYKKKFPGVVHPHLNWENQFIK